MGKCQIKKNPAQNAKKLGQMKAMAVSFMNWFTARQEDFLNFLTDIFASRAG